MARRRLAARTMPPTVPVGVLPVSNGDVGAACPYLVAGPKGYPHVRPEACRHLTFFRDHRRLVELHDVAPRRLAELSPLEAPSPDVRIARFTFTWDPEAIGEAVHACFRWPNGAALARFARVDGTWQLSGFEDIVSPRTEEPCPADGPQ